MPTVMTPSAAVAAHRCKHCGGILLHADLRHRPVSFMDAALAHHLRRACCTPLLPAPPPTTASPTSTSPAAAPAADGAARWLDFEPPLAALLRAQQVEAALALLARGEGTHGLSLDAPLCGGATLLHLAARTDSVPLVDATYSAAAATRGSQDCVHRNTPGGRTPLHEAAAHGARQAAAALIARGGEALALALDWEGCTPAELARRHGDRALGGVLAEAAARAAGGASGGGGEAGEGEGEGEGALSEEELKVESQWRRAELKSRRRLALKIEGRESLRAAHILRQIWTVAECKWVLEQTLDAAAMEGWQACLSCPASLLHVSLRPPFASTASLPQAKRHENHSTFDIALWRAPAAFEFARTSLVSTIIPAMSRVFDIPLEKLVLREAFVIRYSPQTQASLGVHRDGTLLSCNILLNQPSDFEGGGTCFSWPIEVHASDGQTWRERGEWCTTADYEGSSGASGGGSGDKTHWAVHGRQGDCVIHCGQIPHGAGTVTKGVRFVLVAFVDELVMAEETPHERRSALRSRASSAVSTPADDAPPEWLLAPSAAEPPEEAASIPGASARRCISFGALDLPTVVAPERKLRYRDVSIKRLPQAPS
ncbi:hypothetical protein AB1Y20_015595 [Prymnesium parvum]|uniref:Fe2OG dioxygenase domain-containing protein n=1 Tax=Prymnesium parvum TaxID=97485 RepID=A0AB34JX83_PRYPA